MNGDLRIILHSPYGRRVHEPWAVAVTGRIHALWGADASVVASDGGIVARIPDTDGTLPDAAILLFEPEKLLANCPRGGTQFGTFRRPFSRMCGAGR
ncbi:hypothetical protein ACLK19_11165 [Escherichia coli]